MKEPLTGASGRARLKRGVRGSAAWLGRTMPASGHRILARSAARFAAAPVLETKPGWRFNHATTPAERLRAGIWWGLHLLPVREAVVLPWVDGLRINLFVERDISRSIYALGCLEPNEMTFFRSVLEPGMVVLDAGANEGLYSILAARAVGSTGVVVAVEPSPRELRRIDANIKLNRLGNVRVVPKGLLDKAGSAVLHAADAIHSGHNTFGGFVYESVSGVEDTDVQVTTVDDLLQQQGLSRLDVLKIDVEGAEAGLIRGAHETLQRLRPLIVMELQEPSLRAMGASAGEVLGLLKDHDYRVYGFSERSGRPERLDATGADNIAAVPAERVAAMVAARLVDD